MSWVARFGPAAEVGNWKKCARWLHFEFWNDYLQTKNIIELEASCRFSLYRADFHKARDKPDYRDKVVFDGRVIWVSLVFYGVENGIGEVGE